MNFELLPNEIILDLFDYFNGIDLLHAFYGLHFRFNHLLYKQFRFYRFEFNSVPKRNFDMIRQQHLPFVAGRVVELRLFDSAETREQIDLFFSYIPSFQQFIQLRSLSIFKIYSYEKLIKVINECQHLSNLTRLSLFSCFIQNRQADFQLIVNKIWSLPKLTNCYFSIHIEIQQFFLCTNKYLFLSLERITICQSKLRLNDINRLFEHIPHLKYLSAPVKILINNNYIASALPTLTQLNIHFANYIDISKMNVYFQNIPNLRCLSVRAWFQLVNGCLWELIIHNFLPKLKTFRRKMFQGVHWNQNIQEEVDRLVDSFRSPFWINEHQ